MGDRTLPESRIREAVTNRARIERVGVRADRSFGRRPRHVAGYPTIAAADRIYETDDRGPNSSPYLSGR